MLPEDDPQLRDVLLEAAELPPDRRAKFLDIACAGDVNRIREVQSLLFQLSDDPNPAPTPPAGPHPERIGRYQLLQPIGEGGMGTVYRAVQEHPVRRTVALKLVKLGMDTRQVVARFQAERQALALMDHPNIARVFDAGATDTGRPYFVMELVEGEPLTRYCEQRRLSIPRRLELFVSVCQAVQHAHQKGIIHRDLKPSNILVGEVDGHAVPKVIDFGIAKATAGRLTEQTLTATAGGTWVGTPHYMSPEQLDGGGDVDTRSDVYSLGVVLYEMLCGCVPFDFGTAGYSEVQRIVREVEPPPPSSRAGALAPSLRGDLDRIVAKAMEKDRTRRYETASALAADVQRYLRHEPVTAGPRSAVYRLGKFARRHRLGLAAMATVVTCVGLVAASIIYGAFRDARQREAHIVALKQEHARTAEARGEADAVNRFIAEMLDSDSLHSFRSAAGGFPASQAADTTVREMLGRAIDRLDHGALKDQPKVEAEVRMTLGRAYRGLGMLPAATEQFRQARVIRERLFGPDNLDVATSLNELGFMLRFQNGDEEAATVLGEALRVRRKFLGDKNLPVAETLDSLGAALIPLGDYRGAEAALREAQRLQHALRRGDHSDLAAISDSLGILLQYEGDLQGAEREFQESRRVWGKVLSEDDPLVGRALLRLGMVLGWKGDLEHAEESELEALEIFRKRSLDLHPDVGTANNWLGLVLESRGEEAKAENAFRKAMRIWDKTLGEGNPDRDAPHSNLARVLLARGDRSEASRLARECADGDLRRVEKALAGKPDDAHLLARRAEVLARLGRFEPALSDYARAIALDPKQYLSWQQRACLRLYLGDEVRYRQECQQMLAQWGTTDDQVIGEAIARVCLLAPEPVGDLSVLRRLAGLREAEPVAPWLEPWFQQTRGLAQYRAGDPGGAIESLNNRRARFSYSAYGRNSAADFYLAMAHERLGHARQARAALARGRERDQKYMFEAGKGDLGHGGLVNWLACRIARREAEAGRAGE